MASNQKAELQSRNKAYAAGSILASVAFVEAVINELICDIVDNAERMRFVPQGPAATIKEEWQKEGHKSLERKYVLRKFQIVLETLEIESFKESSDLYVGMTTLIDLRNVLIHFKPEWNSVHSPHLSQSENQHQLLDKLQGRFPPCILFEVSGNPFFPDKCIGYGCSEWALRNAVKFVDEFHEKVRLKPIYEHVKGSIANSDVVSLSAGVRKGESKND